MWLIGNPPKKSLDTEAVDMESLDMEVREIKKGG
jgi:hypothetical protein